MTVYILKDVFWMSGLFSGLPRPFAAMSQLPAALWPPQQSMPMDVWSM